MLDLLDDMLVEMGIVHARLDGTMDNELRPAMIADFNREGSTMNVFLISTRAGGVGINLQSADTVILAESDWNPQADLQAVSRVQRIGQKRTVHVMRLVTHKQIDELIIQRAREKKRIEAVAVGAGKFSSGTEGLRDMHQRDIAKLLDDLDAVAPVFTETKDVASDEVADGVARKSVESATTAPSVANSVLPTLDKAVGPAEAEVPMSTDDANALRPCKEMLVYAAEWDKLLLRTGETSLPALGSHPVWPLASPTVVPSWLKVSAEDATFILAGLKANGPLDAARAVQAAKEEVDFLAGQSKRDRGSRKSRFSLAELDDSDFESRSDSSQSSAERRPRRKNRRRRRNLARVNLVSSDDDVYMPSDGVVDDVDDDDDDDEKYEGSDMELEEEEVIGRKIAERLSENPICVPSEEASAPAPALPLAPEGIPEQALNALRAPLARPPPLREPVEASSLRFALQGIAASRSGAEGGEMCATVTADSALEASSPRENATSAKIFKTKDPESTGESVGRHETSDNLIAVPTNRHRNLSDPVKANTLRQALRGLATAAPAADPEEANPILPAESVLDARPRSERDVGTPAKAPQTNAVPIGKIVGQAGNADSATFLQALQGVAASGTAALPEEGKLGLSTAVEPGMDACLSQGGASPPAVTDRPSPEPSRDLVGQSGSANKTAVSRSLDGRAASGTAVMTVEGKLDLPTAPDPALDACLSQGNASPAITVMPNSEPTRECMGPSGSVDKTTLSRSLQGPAASGSAPAPAEENPAQSPKSALDARLSYENASSPKVVESSSEPTREYVGLAGSGNKTIVSQILQEPAAAGITAVPVEGNPAQPSESALDSHLSRGDGTPVQGAEANSDPTVDVVGQVGSSQKTAVLDLTLTSQAASQPIYLAATPEMALVARPEGNRYLTDTMELELAFRKELRNRRLRKSLPATNPRPVRPRDPRHRGRGASAPSVEPPPPPVKRARWS